MALEGALYEAVTNYLVKKTGGDPHYAGYTHSPGVKPDTAKFLQIDHFGSSIEPQRNSMPMFLLLGSGQLRSSGSR
ncbi:hypothetical protein LCGC14_3053420, partial [marine sediment metagenome]